MNRHLGKNISLCLLYAIAGWILIVSIVAMLNSSSAASSKANYALRAIHQRLGLAISYFKPLEPSPAPAVRLRATQR